jgi:hypothetical protein
MEFDRELIVATRTIREGLAHQLNCRQLPSFGISPDGLILAGRRQVVTPKKNFQFRK